MQASGVEVMPGCVACEWTNRLGPGAVLVPPVVTHNKSQLFSADVYSLARLQFEISALIPSSQD